MINRNDASINIRGNVSKSEVQGGKIHTVSSTNPTENKVAIEVNGDVTDSAKVVGGEILISADLRAEILETLESVNRIPVTNKESIAIDAIKQKIKENPTLKQRLISASKAGGTEALKAIFDHPVISISIETIKGFLEA